MFVKAVIGIALTDGGKVRVAAIERVKMLR